MAYFTSSFACSLVHYGRNRTQGGVAKKECDELIKLTEEKGYEVALLNTGGGRQVLAPEIRSSYRCIWDSVERADWLWQRMKDYVPEEWDGRKVIGLNERLRFLRYDKDQYFKPHYDGSYVRDNGEISCITLHLYLNEGYEGGCTTFLHPLFGKESGYLPVQVKTGMVLVFEHRILHEGSTLINGRKYTMRTDVMYQAKTY
ncbi:uncharacterized protein LOC135686450 isoform X2 [Rhopilema esculentum]|uniref:uncharacterized protein LOC135686450 isoform X2 n=1 Tax=Rhopilema esculentum TaxID=499914 RepID=UPI0031E1EABF